MGGMRPSGLHVNKPALVSIVALFVILAVGYRYLWTSNTVFSPKVPANDAVRKGGEIPTGSGADYRETLNLTSLQKPPAFDESGKTLAKESKSIEIELDGKILKVYLEQVINNYHPKQLDILFLHGAKFSTKNWIDIHAMDRVASWGHRAIAVDLPGHGLTKDTIDVSQEKNFLAVLISSLKMKQPVIVSPSFSGRYSLPFLFSDPAKSTELAIGFVAVAPTSTDIYKEQYASSQLPTLIVYGTEDVSGQKTLSNLHLLPKSLIAPIPEAGHACYLDKPDAFFSYLYTFLERITRIH